MLDPNLATVESQEKRRKAVRDYVLREIEDESITLTETELRTEPLRSDSNEVLDGIVVENNRSKAEEEALETGSVKLVHVKPDGVIRYRAWEKRRVPGSDREIRFKADKVVGNFGDVPNTFPHRIARNIIHQVGWPARQYRQEGNFSEQGDVVEWRWLDREAKKPDAYPELVALRDEIRTRPGFLEFIGEAPRKKQDNTKSTQQAVSP